MHATGPDSASIAAAVQRCEPWKSAAQQRPWTHHRHHRHTLPPRPPKPKTRRALPMDQLAFPTRPTHLRGRCCTAAVGTDFACMKKASREQACSSASSCLGLPLYALCLCVCVCVCQFSSLSTQQHLRHPASLSRSTMHHPCRLDRPTRAGQCRIIS